MTQIDWRYKALPPTGTPNTSSIGTYGWNLLSGDLLLPALVVKRNAVDHNLELMRSYCATHQVDLAPHAKTSMSPQLLLKHKQAGAWGFTVATTSQARVLRHFQFNRLILASQLVERSAIEWISSTMDSDDDFTVTSLVDSIAAVAILDRNLAEIGARRPLPVLVELGQMGGRTGCRTVEAAISVAQRIKASKHLALVGVEGFEGLIPAPTQEATIEAVDMFLSQMRELVTALDAGGQFEDLDEVMVTAGGSAYFDRVVEHLTNWVISKPVRTILRSGCYATHDVEMYEGTSPLASRGGNDHARLIPALEVWAAVWSRPEPDLAIIGFGKRDAAYDYRLPVPLTVVESGSGSRPASGFHVMQLNDQHAYVRMCEDDSLSPGDMMSFGISHPCAAFDKWRLIPVVDDKYNIVDAWQTFF